MTRNARRRMTLDIVTIRQLQWEKARTDALRLRHQADRADDDATRAKDALQSCLAQAGQAVKTLGSLSPSLLMGWMHATDAAHSHVQRCHSAAAQARAELHHQMEALQRQQDQCHQATRLAKQAQRDCNKRAEEKRASAIEDRFLAHGARR